MNVKLVIPPKFLAVGQIILQSVQCSTTVLYYVLEIQSNNNVVRAMSISRDIVSPFKRLDIRCTCELMAVAQRGQDQGGFIQFDGIIGIPGAKFRSYTIWVNWNDTSKTVTCSSYVKRKSYRKLAGVLCNATSGFDQPIASTSCRRVINASRLNGNEQVHTLL